MAIRTHGFDVGDLQVRRAYDSNQNEEYVGLASPVAATSELRWRIMKRAYDANQNEVSTGFPRLSAATAFSDEFIYEWDEHTTYVYSND